jgi:hypothetical protein
VPFTLTSFAGFSVCVSSSLSFDLAAVGTTGGLGAMMEKSPALATPPARTFSTQFAIIGINLSNDSKLNWNV